jgi:hypothetical protein
MAGAAPGSIVSVPVQALNLTGSGLGSAALEIRYNPAVLTPMECQADPAGGFDTETCNLDIDRDGVAPDALSLSITSAGGVAGSPILANLVFQVSGNSGEFTPLEVTLQSIAAPGGEPLNLKKSDGLVCVTPCQNIAYMPIMPKFFELPP